jgi:hypothetical protein
MSFSIANWVCVGLLALVILYCVLNFLWGD